MHNESDFLMYTLNAGQPVPPYIPSTTVLGDEYCTHITSGSIKFLIGVNFCGDLHLDVSRCCNKLKLKVKIGISLSIVE